ncbi:MAG TPA: choice-of-anchor tandem repeat GloVer-containing protein [Rhizomicrobium sp.]|jgi:uncharacterized repeat protein (TIGR03803 family)|nr:choice-of-anchor tandem repeat GloVer-containing protein [Rhizomicrobium sp.]
MNRNIQLSRKCVFGCGLALGLFVPFADACAQDTTLYTFSGGSDGGNPPCGLISGGKGVLPAQLRFFGTTEYGGAYGYGTVFEATNAGFMTVLHSFGGGGDGASPQACVITDSSGHLYGTTEEGGTYDHGVVFKLSGGTETVLHSFGGGGDGANPFAGLIMDGAGNLYGTTIAGGGTGCGGGGCGTVFEVMPGGGETVLHSFAGSDGAYPVASLAMDKAGNLYGTTAEGGASTNCGGGCGTVFELAAGGGETVVHSFSGGDGATPEAAVIVAGAGNLYGTTEAGGANDDGTVFEVSHKGKEAVLHSFGGGSDGAYPLSAVLKKGGFLYGTTFGGGANGSGTVYKTPGKGGSDTLLYSFTGGSDGGLPEGGVLIESGNLFGTTYAGGMSCEEDENGCGVVFELAP